MESIWSGTCDIPKRPALQGHQQTQVAVIGAGLAGILTAYLLEQAGKQVIVLEADRIASGQSQNTTAKITAQHGLIYANLISKQGMEKARAYAQANLQAIEQYDQLITEKRIACDFQRRDSYVFSQNKQELQAEVQAAQKLGLPAEFTGDIPIPIPAAGAVRFSNQAQFHPLKFIAALADGLAVYEHSAVRSMDGTVLYTDDGSVEAQQVVFACHYPFLNWPGLYFTRMHQERSYVLALKGAPQVDGMYLGVGSNAYSLRNWEDLLLFGGENHRTGENQEGGRYRTLREKAQELFPGSREVAHWSAQDCMTADHIPFIGQYAPARPDWYVATGFEKWGMTSSMVAAQILCARICGEETPYDFAFSPSRFSLEELSGIAGEGVQAVKGLTKTLFEIPEETIAELKTGHGGIVTVGEEKIGVYKSENGICFGVKTRCPHLGCQLEWNPDERSWDCPCHGSRFDYRGILICGPAQENLPLLWERKAPEV